jgi:glycosyltransferase involved in cell wall biosynthesis
MIPIISVVLPVYNGEKTITETINSVLKQTFTDFELIVINDGSQDSTLNIINEITDPRIQVYSYPNKGLAASRNRGIAQATGQYICFIDADDLWTIDKLDAQFKALQENSQAALAYSWTDYIDESSQFIRSGSYMSVMGDVYANLLLVDFLENGSNPLIRSEALAAVGNFDESLTSAEDWDMWLRLAARYPFVAVSSAQILYRVSANSMSANVLRMEAETMLVIERAFELAPASLQYLKPYSQANIYKYLTYKVLEGLPERRKGLTAMNFFVKAVTKDPGWLPQRQILLKIIFKIVVVALLPPQQAQALIAKFKSLPKIQGILLTYTRVNLT